MSDGVQKLTEYLNQTRRQAESAIDTLNEKIRSLVSENEDILKALKSVKAEKDHYKEAADRLQKENSKKWKFQERDDWKALVDSVQRDRSQLQEENNALKARLEAELEKNDLLQQEIVTLADEVRRLVALSDPTGFSSATISSSSQSTTTTTTISQHLAGHTTPTPAHIDGFSDVPLTPVGDSRNTAQSTQGGDSMLTGDLSPRSSTIVSLRTELDQVQRKVLDILLIIQFYVHIYIYNNSNNIVHMNYYKQLLFVDGDRAKAGCERSASAIRRDKSTEEASGCSQQLSVRICDASDTNSLYVSGPISTWRTYRLIARTYRRRR